ncbi:MAG: hypothetical protein NW208_00190 [Bryobacter sp.]|nr:hypothetical protein [Bryobacter sp.]
MLSLRYLVPALAMMLGWGLRGFIGGGPFGAMIPGAMFGLSLLLTRPATPAALFAAYSAVALGFGGEMTYGQTVGFIVQRETFWWGFLGLAVKGAVWGALAAPFLALGARAHLAVQAKLLRVAALLAVVATYLGWMWVNHPKLIYFSNRLDRPREEVWAGVLLAALAVTILMKSWRLTLAGFLGGAIGFGFGGAIQGVGRIFFAEWNLHWWKYMEFFFGFALGYALALAFPEEQEQQEIQLPKAPIWFEYPAAAALVGLLVLVANVAQSRFGYMLAALPALIVVTRWPWLAGHLAYTATFFAFALDVTSLYPAIAASLAFAVGTARWRDRPWAMLMATTWSAVAYALLKFATGKDGLSGLLDHIAFAFVAMAALLTWATREHFRQGAFQHDQAA